VQYAPAAHSHFVSALPAFVSTVSLIAPLLSSASFHRYRAPKPISRPCPPPTQLGYAQPCTLHVWISLTRSSPHLFYTGIFFQINVRNNQVHSSFSEIQNIFTKGLKARNIRIPLSSMQKPELHFHKFVFQRLDGMDYTFKTRVHVQVLPQSYDSR